MNNKTKVKEHIPNLRTGNANGKMITTETDAEKAEVLNSYFAGVFTNEDPLSIPGFQDCSGSQVLAELDISRQQITDKISKLKVDKSPGLDGVHPRVLFELKMK